MREIVDRFHPDCFVESYFMGFTVDLSEVWMPYRAATLALENTLEPSHIREMIETNVERERKCLEELNHYLTEVLWSLSSPSFSLGLSVPHFSQPPVPLHSPIKGILTEEYVLDNVNRLLNCLRNCNVCLRWWLLRESYCIPLLASVAASCLGVVGVVLFLLLLSWVRFFLSCCCVAPFFFVNISAR